jgi:hypothetical protein
MLTTKPIDRRARTEEAEESMEAEAVSTSPSVHDKSRGGKEVRREHEQPKGRTRKGANPDTTHGPHSQRPGVPVMYPNSSAVRPLVLLRLFISISTSIRLPTPLLLVK